MTHDSTTNGNYPNCQAKRRDGQPCQGRARPGSSYCWAHDPELADKRQAARSQGGQNRANIVRLRGLMPPKLIPIFETLEEALSEVHDGSLSPSRAQAMASLARAMVAVLNAGEMEERLRSVEAQLAQGDDREWA